MLSSYEGDDIKHLFTERQLKYTLLLYTSQSLDSVQTREALHYPIRVFYANQNPFTLYMTLINQSDIICLLYNFFKVSVSLEKRRRFYLLCLVQKFGLILYNLYITETSQNVFQVKVNSFCFICTQKNQ